MAQHDLNYQQCRWHIQADEQRLLDDLAADIAELANRAIAERGEFSIVLAGGTTPQKLYQRLALIDTDWLRWQIYFGDERCLPDGDAQRNDEMARTAWLDHVAIAARNIHRIAADRYADAAPQYVRQLQNVPCFDLVLLGVGEDGHTASLFPDDLRGFSADAPPVVFIDTAPKWPPQRISLSAARLAATKALWFLATGEGKRDILTRWRRGERVVASRIAPTAGVDIFTDQLPD